ncbi:MAG: regulator [Gammaproteobacteria bacterium]|nr:regulator [Gammaproteobacteria bacterium]
MLLVAACGRAPQQAATPTLALPKIQESFGIGAGVYARTLAVDEKAGALWIGTSVGVHEVDLASRDVRNTYSRSSGLANEYVFAIFVDAQGAKWFGTNGGGVSRLKDGQWQTFFPMHGLADYWVYSLGMQPDGVMWIGTWAGASRLVVTGQQPGRVAGVFTNFVGELVNEWVYGIDVDRQGRVWFGTEGGVSMYDGKQWYGWTHEDELGAPNRLNLPPSKNTGLGTRDRHDLSLLASGQPTYNPGYVFAIHVARDGTVWAGTWGGGVSYFDGKRWRNLTTEQGLAGNIVFAITEDRNGDLWFGTDHGISRYDGKTWQTIGRDQGLPEDHVYALAATAKGQVWAGMRGNVVLIGRSAATTQDNPASKVQQ